MDKYELIKNISLPGTGMKKNLINKQIVLQIKIFISLRQN